MKNKRGLSVVELATSAGIAVLIFLIVFWTVQFHVEGIQRGNDNLNVHTASSVARTSRADGFCVVTNCTGGVDCTHKTPEGTYEGYYNIISGNIEGEVGAGYNESTKMTIGKKVYKGTRHTMVIKATGKDNKVIMSWVQDDPTKEYTPEDQ